MFECIPLTPIKQDAILELFIKVIEKLWDKFEASPMCL